MTGVLFVFIRVDSWFLFFERGLEGLLGGYLMPKQTARGHGTLALFFERGLDGFASVAFLRRWRGWGQDAPTSLFFLFCCKSGLCVIFR